ncbi:MAG: DUF5317 domain-containing protein [Anaerolineae bacterium]
MILAVALSTVLGLLRGGRLANLGGVSLRHPYLIIVGLGLQVAIFSPLWPDLFKGPPTAILYVDALALLLLAVLLNSQLPGIKLLGVGLALNVLAIASNGGWMPVRLEAVHQAGLAPIADALETTGHYRHLIPLGESSALWVLTDVLPVPGPGPQANVYSVGDLLVAAGAFWFVQKTMTQPLPLADAAPPPVLRMRRGRRNPALPPGTFAPRRRLRPSGEFQRETRGA